MLVCTCDSSDWKFASSAGKVELIAVKLLVTTVEKVWPRPARMLRFSVRLLPIVAS
jgi:hypothetical protein